MPAIRRRLRPGRFAAVLMIAQLGAWAHAEPAAYLADRPIDATRFLAPPPAVQSLQQQADAAAVRSWQAQKDGERWRQAQRDDDISPFPAFASVLGPRFTAANLPRLATLFDRLFADVKSVTAPAKRAYDRPRPPLVDPAIVTCQPLEQTASYPSGHAARGWLMALVLSEMAPERADALLARGREYGDSRVVCGEHFPSDVEAGRLIGAAVAAGVTTAPGFADDWAAARDELRTTLGLPRDRRTGPAAP
jgi:acid phosphatase (class A)